MAAMTDSDDKTPIAFRTIRGVSSMMSDTRSYILCWSLRRKRKK